MKGIRFGDMHSYNDLKMILSGKEMGAPAVKSKKLDIEGADSALDLTDFFGEPKYEDVTHKFQFATIVPYGEFMTLYSTIKNAIHGKKMRIILDDDPLFYWMGRCYVSGFTNEKSIGQVEVECDCEPYKYKLTKTVYSQAVNGTDIIVLTNGRKRAVPKITTTGALTIEYGGGSWTISAGSYTIPELELTHGDNAITVTGTGIITFEWQEGDL
jgi:phage-related protein